MLKYFATSCTCTHSLTAELAAVSVGAILGLMIWWRGLISDSAQKVAGLLLFSISASTLTTRGRAQSVLADPGIQSGDCPSCAANLFSHMVNQPIHFGLLFFGAFGATVITLSILNYIVNLASGK